MVKVCLAACSMRHAATAYIYTLKKAGAYAQIRAVNFSGAPTSITSYREPTSSIRSTTELAAGLVDDRPPPHLTSIASPSARICGRALRQTCLGMSCRGQYLSLERYTKSKVYIPLIVNLLTSLRATCSGMASLVRLCWMDFCTK